MFVLAIIADEQAWSGPRKVWETGKPETQRSFARQPGRRGLGQHRAGDGLTVTWSVLGGGLVMQVSVRRATRGPGREVLLGDEVIVVVEGCG
jgi:N-methylhydantoinase B/oxoprolinase/acetone carboxylase alpha subunit